MPHHPVLSQRALLHYTRPLAPSLRFPHKPSAPPAQEPAMSFQTDELGLKHFPVTALMPWKVDALHPQDYLLTLYSIHPAVVMGKLAAISRDRAVDLEDAVIHLGKSLPRFAARIIEDMGDVK